MAKRKVAPEGPSFTSEDKRLTQSRKRPRNAIPSSSTAREPLTGHSEQLRTGQVDREPIDDRATTSAIDEDEDVDEQLQTPVDFEALEEQFRPQIEAARIANAGRRGVGVSCFFLPPLSCQTYLVDF
jgi:hypothetical protein